MMNYKESIRVLSKLGAGAFGEVFHIMDADGKEEVLKYNYKIDTTTFINGIRECCILTMTKGIPWFVQIKTIVYCPDFDDPQRLIKDTEESDNSYISGRLHYILEKEEFSMNNAMKNKENMDKICDNFKIIFRRVLLAIAQLHKWGIYHRDVTPGNILFSVNKNDPEGVNVRLCDYGISGYYCSTVKDKSRVTAWWYRAPEIACDKFYDKKVDIWSLGISIQHIIKQSCFAESSTNNENQTILHRIRNVIPGVTLNDLKYISLSGYPLNDDNNNNADKWKAFLSPPRGKDRRIYDSIFNDKTKGDIFIDLLSKMIKVTPSGRLSAIECLKHPFFDDEITTSGIDKIISMKKNVYKFSHTNADLILNFLKQKKESSNNIVGTLGLFRRKKNQNPFPSANRVRIAFHALRIYQQSIYKASEKRVPDTAHQSLCLYIAYKLFKKEATKSMKNYLGISYQGETFHAMEDLELCILIDVFKCQLFVKTEFEEMSENEFELEKLISLLKSYCE